MWTQTVMDQQPVDMIIAGRNLDTQVGQTTQIVARISLLALVKRLAIISNLVFCLF